MVPEKGTTGSGRPAPEPTRMALFGKSYRKESILEQAAGDSSEDGGKRDD